MNKYLKISFALNIVTTVFVIVAYVMGTFNIHFVEDPLSSNGYDLLKYFTVQSNLLAGAASALTAWFTYKVIKGRATAIPKGVVIFKYLSVIGVSVTMFTVMFYLAPITKSGYFSLFVNSNLFFHFLAPLLSLLSFVLFEHTEVLTIKHTFFGMAHFVLYGAVYMIIAYSNMVGGVIPHEYNWYLLADPDPIVTVFTSAVMTALVYVVCLLVYIGNKKIKLAR